MSTLRSMKCMDNHLAAPNRGMSKLSRPRSDPWLCYKSLEFALVRRPAVPTRLVAIKVRQYIKAHSHFSLPSSTQKPP